MNRRYRLSNSSDFQRVRRTGTSYAHPLAVLVVSHGDSPLTRFGFSAGRSLGGAVQRNRAKRLLREAVRHHLAEVRPGWDAVFIARAPILGASWKEIEAGVNQLLHTSGLLDG
ncbi:MAG: ribonuclease P protein component [Anaerolineales bacterium]